MKSYFSVPTWLGVDIPAAMLMASGTENGCDVPQSGNPVFDYVWNTVRRRFGGRLHARNDGIKPFIQSVRQGYWGYSPTGSGPWAEHSEFVDFYTYKTNVTGGGRLMKVCHARGTACSRIRWENAPPDDPCSSTDG